MSCFNYFPGRFRPHFYTYVLVDVLAVACVQTTQDWRNWSPSYPPTSPPISNSAPLNSRRYSSSLLFYFTAGTAVWPHFCFLTAPLSVYTGRWHKLPHGLHCGSVQPESRELQHSPRRPAQGQYQHRAFMNAGEDGQLIFFFSPLNSEQTNCRQDHSSYCHHHICSGGPCMPGALQDRPRPQEARVLQKRFHELGTTLLCIFWTDCGS